MRVFLCAAQADRSKAEEIALALRSDGHQVFLDEHELPPADSYNARIREGVARADLIVFFISPASLEAGRYTLLELKMIQDKWQDPRGRVLPVLISPVDPKAVPAYLRGVNLCKPSGNLAAAVAYEISRMSQGLVAGDRQLKAAPETTMLGTPKFQEKSSWLRIPRAYRARPVDATAFCPTRFQAGESELLQIFIHERGQRRQASKAARLSDSYSRIAAPSQVMSGLKIGDLIKVDVKVAGAIMDSEPIAQRWAGEMLNFTARLTADGQASRVSVSAMLSVNETPVGQIVFARSVKYTWGLSDVWAWVMRPRLSRFKRVFFSYSSADRQAVLRYAEQYDKMGITFFHDILHLSPGERWKRRLWTEIDRCDLFILFWSSNAKKSEWVLKEVNRAWRRHVKTRGRRPAIRPEILEHPISVPDQQWLRTFHFNDSKFFK